MPTDTTDPLQVNTIYREFCQTVVGALEKQWVKMIAANEMADHVREFSAVTGFPKAVGQHWMAVIFLSRHQRKTPSITTITKAGTV